MRKYGLFLITFIFLFSMCKSSQTNHTTKDHKYINALIHETSPYLLQHAHNPVDWHAWNDAALKEARDSDKLLIISVGYTACHWCHVMEHESFEDSLVAEIMNEHFVPIKVDREERPDIDDVYMSACQLVSRRGCGWPLNAFALPDGRPIWAGTYFPKDQWIKILDQFVNLKKDEPGKLEEMALQLTEGIRSFDNIEVVTDDREFTEEEVNQIADKFIAGTDMKEGGKKGAPKFPMPSIYDFLMKYDHLMDDQEARNAVSITLEKMARGGIYDQAGGGFARYSTDGIWMVPHFEKMLYDNGQLVSLYSRAYRSTQNPLYKNIIEETLEFVNRELTSPDDGFYASLDADSEGEEGKFYVWQKYEIEKLISDERNATIFNEYFSIKDNGNWEHVNILHTTTDIDGIKSKYSLTDNQLTEILEDGKSKLMEARKNRVRPLLDDKILSSWNGLMLNGYIEAYKALGNKEYLKMAIKNANFIEANLMKSDNRLDRNYKNGKSTINAFLDDYTTISEAFISLYEVTFDEKWLYKAKDLTDYAITHFSNDETKMFNYTSDLDPKLIARKSELGDNVIPGSNSMMARNLNKLGLYFYNESYLTRSDQMLKNIMSQITATDQPSYFSNWCQLIVDRVRPLYEIAIVGDNAAALRDELMGHYIPHALLLGGKTEGSLDLLKDKLQEGETYIYVCRNKVCKFPVTSVAEALKLMN